MGLKLNYTRTGLDPAFLGTLNALIVRHRSSSQWLQITKAGGEFQLFSDAINSVRDACCQCESLVSLSGVIDQWQWQTSHSPSVGAWQLPLIAYQLALLVRSPLVESSKWANLIESNRNLWSQANPCALSWCLVWADLSKLCQKHVRIEARWPRLATGCN